MDHGIKPLYLTTTDSKDNYKTIGPCRSFSLEEGNLVVTKGPKVHAKKELPKSKQLYMSNAG